MKKNYVKPAIALVDVHEPLMLDVSGNRVDKDGSLDPASRSHGNLWDDEDDF